ncbi:helix-turn-helix domain containing protein [Paracoccus sp. PS-1]|uniref:TetR/AcrR family transcriptional regulator n=1 Tax=unclassified Paracoccus (in: a-proteobacteria) TaxID=2688777 RepID=UPI000687AF6E|nr:MULTISPECIES: TetR/AcrR family transcriptional regulator [unclassified Paracoccus (in: a-proteobacteria)]MDQ7261399.1 helix-turn-helix domain containing protein [Paracoccus sp. PS1]
MSTVIPMKHEQLSRTEIGKRDKLRRIREASRALFLSRGYEEATIREIARLAEVAQGTLFLYAASKRDLLFMLYNDIIEAAAAESLAVPHAELSLAEALMHIALANVQAYTADIAIARLGLVNLNLYDDSDQASRFVALHGTVTDLVARLLREGRDDGRLSADFDVGLIAGMVISVMVEGLKTYLRADLPDIARMMRDTHGQIAVILRGLGAGPETLVIRDQRIAGWLASPRPGGA